MGIIEYRTTPTRSWRGYLKLIGLALAATFVAIIALCVIPLLKAELEFLHWQHDLLNYVDPPNTVVYDDDPESASKLLQSGGYAQLPYFGTIAGVNWQPVARRAPLPLRRLGPFETVCLVHGRSANGIQRLVIVEMSVENREEVGEGRVIHFAGKVFDIREDTAELFRRSTSSCEFAGLEPGDRVRVLAGEPDRSDPSRFRVRFLINSRPRVVEGKLGADTESITLKIPPE